MTPEEIQRTINEMLAVQQELQNSQLKFRESLVELGQDISELRIATADLKEISARHERRMQQLIGYSINWRVGSFGLDTTVTKFGAPGEEVGGKRSLTNLL